MDGGFANMAFGWFHGWDLSILHFFNVDLGNPIMDRFWLTVTHLERVHLVSTLILPLLLVSLVYIYRWSALKMLAVLAFTVGLSDALAYRVIKNLLHRSRPFENPEISGWLRHVGDAHGPSFPSNHAANCFAGAVVLAWYFPNRAKYFYILALIISLSRIALGVHYPSDVAAGAFLGIFVGGLVRALVLNLFPTVELKRHVPKKNRTFVRD